MVTTEDWIVWSEHFGFTEYSANRQLSIEVAMAACRHLRDSAGMSRDPDLANADHYWLARLFGFMAQAPHGLSRGIDHTIGPGVTSNAVGDLLAALGWGVGATPVILMTVAWDGVKASGLLDRAMEAREAAYEAMGWPVEHIPPASDHSMAQTAWAVAGYGHAGIYDMPFARDARPWFRINEVPGTIALPAPPH